MEFGFSQITDLHPSLGGGPWVGECFLLVLFFRAERKGHLKIVFYKNTKLLIVTHKGAANAASVLNTGTAQFAAGVGEVAYASCVALYVTLLGGLADSEHDLPRSDFKERASVSAISLCFTHILIV